MKVEEPHSIGEILSEYLSANNLAMASAEGSIRETWHKVVGDYIANVTNDAFLKKGVLTLSFSSATVKAEIYMNRKFYIKELNHLIGQNIIHSIKIM